MKPQTAVIKLRLRLNKSHSSDYDNILDWAAVEAINKAAIEYTRRNLKGNNPQKESAEETLSTLEDLNFLLTPITLKGRNNKLFFESSPLPSNYLRYSRIIPMGNNGKCFNQQFKPMLVEEANIPEMLMDWSFKPDFEWRHVLMTRVGQKIRIYTNEDFIVDDINLLYYRYPKKMDIEGYTHEDGTDSTNVDLEFKDDIAEIIIDEAAAIIAGDIESINQAQITKERATTNT